MSIIEELYGKAKIFEELMGSLDFIIETKDGYDYPDELYESYLVKFIINRLLI